MPASPRASPRSGNIGPGGLEDPRARQAGHRYQGEVAGMGGLPGRSQQGLELQMGEPEGRCLRWDLRAADVLGG